MQASIDIHYCPNLKHLTQLQLIWQAMHNVSKSVVKTYQSDWFHDALWLERNVKHPCAQGMRYSWWYGVGETGTTIFDTLAQARAGRKDGRTHVYHCTLNPTANPQQWRFCIEYVEA